MSINFPNSPALNDTYTYQGRTWKWTGSAWRIEINATTTGYTGSAGAGFTGFVGSQGVPGEYAALGYTGSQGVTGYTGSSPDTSFYVTISDVQTLSNKTITAANTISSILDSGGVNSFAIGYRQVPQNAQSTAYTLVNSDEGKHIYYTGGAATITIPTDGNTTGGNFSVGSTVAIINHGSANVTISHAGSLFFAGNTTSASRILSAKGVASVIKVAANVWYISGGGLT